MALLDDIRKVLRIKNTAYDNEIQDLIDAAINDLTIAGVFSDKANDYTDPLIKRALVVYCKANFGFDNPDAERLQKSYDMLKMSLSLAGDYNTVGDAE